mmetsp:Transcript_99213/g.285012  ORF Transcript_99213/g.285012 Transcript_99213/m.285012 type:complete len:114 (+) Transcript_99213:57-398(+)
MAGSMEKSVDSLARLFEEEVHQSPASAAREGFDRRGQRPLVFDCDLQIRWRDRQGERATSPVSPAAAAPGFCATEQVKGGTRRVAKPERNLHGRKRRASIASFGQRRTPMTGA